MEEKVFEFLPQWAAGVILGVIVINQVVEALAKFFRWLAPKTTGLWDDKILAGLTKVGVILKKVIDFVSFGKKTPTPPDAN